MQFVGTFHHRVNSKGQVALPAKMRENIEPDENGKRSLFVMRLQEPCLFAMRREELERLSERMQASGMFRQDRRLREAFFASIEPVDVDPQGRFVIPPRLKEEVGLGREVVFVGAGNVVEIWDEKQWKSRSEEMEALRENAAGEITSLLEEI